MSLKQPLLSPTATSRVLVVIFNFKFQHAMDISYLYAFCLPFALWLFMLYRPFLNVSLAALNEDCSFPWAKIQVPCSFHSRYLYPLFNSVYKELDNTLSLSYIGVERESFSLQFSKCLVKMQRSPHRAYCYTVTIANQRSIIKELSAIWR